MTQNEGLTRREDEGLIEFGDRVNKARMLREIEQTESFEELRGLLHSWVEKGTISSKRPPPWSR